MDLQKSKVMEGIPREKESGSTDQGLTNGYKYTKLKKVF
jgi:hypothetical protein